MGKRILWIYLLIMKIACDYAYQKVYFAPLKLVCLRKNHISGAKMKTKTISIATSCLALLGLTVNLAWAEDYYSNVPASPPVATSSSGYNSTGSTSQQEYYSSPVYKKEHHSHHHHKHDKFSI